MSCAPTVNTTFIDDSPAETVSVIIFDPGQRITDELDVDDGELNESEVWLDFANVETVNSAELSALIRFTLRMRQLGKTVCACHVGSELEVIFELTRFRITRIA